MTVRLHVETTPGSFVWWDDYDTEAKARAAARRLKAAFKIKPVDNAEETA